MPKTNPPPPVGDIWHRRGCSCPACDIIRRGDIDRTIRAVKR
jgi:hypothetical protein